MELLQLKYFCAAAESENLSKTAENFSVPTSNISQTVKRLEKELGAPLFTRTANRITLNEHGREFFAEIKKALTIIDNARAQIDKTAASTMKIGIFTNRRIVMNAIERFQKQYPDINLVISHDRRQEDADFDLIISGGLHEYPNLEAHKFFSERVLLAANKDYFESPYKITVDDIRKKPFISMSEGTSLYDINQDICKKLRFTPRIALQSDDPFYIRKCIELGLGIAFVPEFSWQGQFSDEIKLINFGNYTRDVYIYRRSREYEPWYVDKFCSILLSQYKEEN